jgi:hypothetical protein
MTTPGPAATTTTFGFGAPERQSDQSFFVPLTHRVLLQVRVTVTAEGVTPTLDYQPAFQALQTRVLHELVKNRQLYKSPPTLESLQYMTPAWGFMKIGSSVLPSRSMVVRNNIPASQWPCIADYALEGLKISRTLIQPVFSLLFVEPVPQRDTGVIDFDWGVAEEADGSAASELQEVSDVSFMTTASGGAMKIKDPATLQREKLAAKDRVRAAYRAAETARTTADGLASQFYAAYDVSDTESAFSEWADLEDSDSDAEGDDDGASR